MLKLGEPTVRRCIKDEELRAIDIGRGWRIAPDDLEDFFRRHTNRAQSDRESIPATTHCLMSDTSEAPPHTTTNHRK